MDKAKFAVVSLLEETALMQSVTPRAKAITFKAVVEDSIFWLNLKRLIKVLQMPTAMIGEFESNENSINLVYDRFMQLMEHFGSLEDFDIRECALLKDIVKARWNFIHTSSMGFGYMLTPSCSGKPWAPSDKVQTKNELKAYIDIFYVNSNDMIEQCKLELDDYMTTMGSLTGFLETEYHKLSGFQYWCQYGRYSYPALSKIALRLYSIPISSAAAERVWSIYGFIHSKRRNRLLIENVEKLAFIYINQGLLDGVDPNDYIGSEEESGSDSD